MVRAMFGTLVVFLMFPAAWLAAQTLPGAEMSPFTVAAAFVVPVAAPLLLALWVAAALIRALR